MNPRTLVNFEILDKLGEGGLGEVFRCRDRLLEREVAIKVLRPELAAQADVAERFRTEAIALARLNHPNIAAVYSFFREGDENMMVQEFLRGETLERLISRRSAFPWQEAVGYVLQALQGLEHAHGAGVVHRDIKPANVMIMPDGTLKLMDFGIARILRTDRLTRVGYLVGTLEYMSPEQVQGQDADPRSDLYSLGIVLYEMLTGCIPFERGSEFELMKSQVEERPISPRTVGSDVPSALEHVVLRALEKSPSARFQTAKEMRDALQAVIATSSSNLVAPTGSRATRVIETPPHALIRRATSIAYQSLTQRLCRSLPGSQGYCVAGLVVFVVILGGALARAHVMRAASIGAKNSSSQIEPATEPAWTSPHSASAAQPVKFDPPPPGEALRVDTVAATTSVMTEQAGPITADDSLPLPVKPVGRKANPPRISRATAPAPTEPPAEAKTIDDSTSIKPVQSWSIRK